MKFFFIVLLSISFLVRPVSAKLGENENKINASYGKRIVRHPRADGTVSNLYEKGDYLLFVIFLKGVSIFEMYAHSNKTDLSASEITTFLKTNAGGATWAPVKGKERRFERSDHKAEATYVRLAGRPTLTVRLRNK